MTTMDIDCVLSVFGLGSRTLDLLADGHTGGGRYILQYKNYMALTVFDIHRRKGLVSL